MLHILSHPGTGVFCLVLGGIGGMIMKWIGIPTMPMPFWTLIPLGLMVLGGLQTLIVLLIWNRAINESAMNMGVREK